ncbi:MAG: hypothetical protein ACRDJH_14300 [Thermomicrobiales bacterium]
MRQPVVPSPALQSPDVRAVAREWQEVGAALLAEQLERALDEIIALRLAGKALDTTATLDVLFDLYEAEILRKDQVRQRGELDPAQFHEELRAYRLRAAAR